MQRTLRFSRSCTEEVNDACARRRQPGAGPCLADRSCRMACHFDTPALILSPIATITTTPSTAFVPASPMRLAISAPRKYESPTYIPIQPTDASSKHTLTARARCHLVHSNPGLRLQVGPVGFNLYCQLGKSASLSAADWLTCGSADTLSVRDHDCPRRLLRSGTWRARSSSAWRDSPVDQADGFTDRHSSAWRCSLGLGDNVALIWRTYPVHIPRAIRIVV
jgi:hypothetical protein